MIKFGFAGISNQYMQYKKNKLYNIANYVKDLKLDCYEYPCGLSASISKKTQSFLSNIFAQNNIELSIHLPYYINLASDDPLKIYKSVNYILYYINIANYMKVKRLVVHLGSQCKLTRQCALDNIKNNLLTIHNTLEHMSVDTYLCFETMGLKKQIGDIDEILTFCTLDEHFIPCVDFGHLNSLYNGTIKNKDDYLIIFDKIFNTLGKDKLNNIHIHFSKQKYSDKGEIKHLTFDDNIYGPNYIEFIKSLVQLKLTNPYIICESASTQDIDAVTLKNTYLKILY